MNGELFKRLERYRTANNLTKHELARKIDIPETYYYRWAKNGIKGIYKKVIEDFLKQQKS